MTVLRTILSGVLGLLLAIACPPFAECQGQCNGDFNGDNRPDVAILVKEKSSKKLGIIVVHFGSNDYFVLGAGKKVGNGGDDFQWMSNWAVKRKGKVGQATDDKSPPYLKVESLYVEKAESASG